MTFILWHLAHQVQLVNSDKIYNFSDMPKLERIMDWDTPAPWHGINDVIDVNLLIAVNKGCMQAQIDQKTRFRINAGEYLMIPQGAHRYIFCDVDTTSLRVRYTGARATLTHNSCAPSARQLLQQLHEFSNYPQRNQVTQDALLSACLSELQHPSLTAFNTHTDDRSQVFVFWLKQALRGEANINQGAQQLGMSPDHFCRLFKQQYGMSPKTYIMEQRFKQAVEILAEENISTTALAKRVGVHDSALFCKQFKQRFGCTPQNYSP